MEVAWVQVGVACGVFLITGIGAVVQVTAAVKDGMNKIKDDVNSALQIKETEFDSKIGKVWERFDTYKNTCDGTFVRTQTCQLIHNGTERAQIETNRRMESMEKKLDALIVALVEKKG